MPSARCTAHDWSANEHYRQADSLERHAGELDRRADRHSARARSFSSQAHSAEQEAARFQSRANSLREQGYRKSSSLVSTARELAHEYEELADQHRSDARAEGRQYRSLSDRAQAKRQTAESYRACAVGVESWSGIAGQILDENTRFLVMRGIGQTPVGPGLRYASRYANARNHAGDYYRRYAG